MIDTGFFDEYSEFSAVYPNPLLLDADWVDGEDGVRRIEYNTDGYKCLENIREEDLTVRYAVLSSLYELHSLCDRFSFLLAPENIYYGINNNTAVMKRNESEEGMSEEEFLKAYKACIGAALQDRYSYEDYFQGGSSLLKKDGLLKEIFGMQKAEEISVFLRKKFEELTEKNHKTKVLVGKHTVYRLRAAVIILSAFLAMALGFGIYYIFSIRPFSSSVINGFQSYIMSDYEAVELSMQHVSIAKMNSYQKYILADSYIKTADLNNEQKKNILSNISVKSENTLLNYWIYIGRGEVEKAEDCAMQLSDDQLLLYAYMKHRSEIESNLKLGGEKKAEALKELEEKMSPLMEKYKEEEK